MTADEIRRYNEARQLLKELGHDLTGATRSDVLAWVDAEGYEWAGDGWKPRQRQNTTDLNYWLEDTRDEAWEGIIKPMGEHSDGFIAGKAYHLVGIVQRAMEMLQEVNEIIDRGVDLMTTDQLGQWQGVRWWCEIWQDYVINGKPEIEVQE